MRAASDGDAGPQDADAVGRAGAGDTLRPGAVARGEERSHGIEVFLQALPFGSLPAALSVPAYRQGAGAAVLDPEDVVRDGLRAAVAEQRIDRLRIVRGEHQSPASGELRRQQVAHAFQQRGRARAVLGGGGLVEEQRAAGIRPRAGEREREQQALPLAARERRHRRERIEEAAAHRVVAEAPEQVPENAIGADRRRARDRRHVGAGEGRRQRFVGILGNENRALELRAPRPEQGALPGARRTEDPLQRRPWGEAVRARDAAGEHCGADAENAAVQLDPAGSARQRLREQQEEGGGDHGHVRGAPGLRERARRAALVGATEEERRAEGRVGRKAGRTEAVDQRVGDDVDEDGAGHSGEQERAELPAPPQPEPVAEQDRPAFLAANGGGEERVAALLRGPDVVQPAPEAAADPQA